MALVEVPQSRLWQPRAKRKSRIWAPDDEPCIRCATPSIVNVATYEPSYGSASPASLTMTGTNAGHSIVVFAGEVGGGVTWSSVSDGVNTYTTEYVYNSDPSGNTIIALAKGIAGGSVTIDAAFTGSSGYAFMYAFECTPIAGFDYANGDNGYTSGPADVNASNITSPSPLPNLVLSHANDLVLAYVYDSNAVAGGGPGSPYYASPPSGWTLIEYTANYANLLTYTTTSAAGTYAPTAPWTGGAQTWAMYAAAFYGPPTVGGTPNDSNFFGMNF